jgi:DNA-directed RNA polymerase specialized sigma24 family protein
MELDVQRGLEEAKKLASGGAAWEALGRLQEVEIEDVLLRLLRRDIGDLPRSHQEQAVAHALTKLYEAWRAGSDVRSPLGWLKTAARRKASDLRRYQPSEREYDATRHDIELETTGWDDDYASRRAVAVAVGRELLGELGLPSVVDVMTVMFDLVAAGEKVSPAQIGDLIEMRPDTVSQHLRRGLERLESRAADRDLTALIADARAQLDYF